jgi:hypothetical protein
MVVGQGEAPQPYAEAGGCVAMSGTERLRPADGAAGLGTVVDDFLKSSHLPIARPRKTKKEERTFEEIGATLGITGGARPASSPTRDQENALCTGAGAVTQPVVVTIGGTAVAKARVRVTRKGIAYTPAATRKYEAYGRLAAQGAMDGRPPITVPVRAEIGIDLPVPASWSAKRRDAALKGEIRCSMTCRTRDCNPERKITMVDVSQVYGGDTLKAGDLGGKDHVVRIASVEVKKFDDGPKLLIRFEGRRKALIAKKTNSSRIALITGSTNTDAWPGRQ